MPIVEPIRQAARQRRNERDRRGGAARLSATLPGAVKVITLALVIAHTSAPGAANAAAPEAHSPGRAPASLEDYLRAHQLDDFVVAYLESQLREALGDAQVPIAERLATLYSEMIDHAATDEERAIWERKSRALLEQIPAADTEALRLNIYKASYLRAERLAELYRLRAISDEDARTAQRIMREVAAELTSAYRQLDTRLERLAEMDVSGASERAEQVAREIDELEPLASQAAYFGAWARYYEAWLTSSKTALPDALELFGAILQTEGRTPSLDELPESLLSYEHVARTVIGVALCHSEAGQGAAALNWLDALASAADVHPVAEKQADAFRIVVLADAGQWGPLDDHIDSVKSGGELEATIARLLAVKSLEALSMNPSLTAARRLAADAIGALSHQGELRQIVEIADAFDLSLLGDNQFVVSYVLGLKAHEHARAAHASAEPTRDRAVIDAYRRADEILLRAIARPDAVDHPEAAANARYLLAWSKYYQSDFINAASAFDEVAPSLARDEAENARWMRIVSLDRATKLRPGDADLRRALGAAMNDFARQHPSTQRAYRIRYRQAITSTSAPMEDRVKTLLAIPPGSDTYDAAQREAERMLYQLFRDSEGDHKLALAHQYIEVAAPLYESDQRLAYSSSGDEAIRERFLIGARRLLDVMLTRGVARVQDARRVLDRVESGAASGVLDIAEVSDELEYRRFQILALTGQAEQASAWADSIWSRDPESPFAIAATQAIFSYALQDWRAFPNDPRLPTTLERALKYGRRLLEARGPEPDLSDPATIAMVAAVAETAHELSQRTNHDEARSLAEAWYPRLLAAEPRNHRFLKASAEIAERAGDVATAYEHWRTAVNGMNASQPAWFEAKYHMLRLLAQIDPNRAAEVMRQHVLLHPDYGPRPWNDRLLELRREIDERSSAPADEAGKTGGAANDAEENAG